MDQGPLVIEQIEAGAKLAADFDAIMPLRTAFWLKESQDGEWYLYLVSDQIDDSNFDNAYREVIRLLGPGPHRWLDSFAVKVASADNPIAKDIIDIQRRYPGRLHTRLGSRMLGGVYIDDAFLYAMPVTTAI